MRSKSRGPFSASLLSLILVLAACGADDGESTSEAAEDSANEEDGHSHGHSIEVPEGMTVPTISIEVVADPMSGQNLFVKLADFDVSPETASTDPVDGQGHLHLYVDGERTARFYNEALHLTGLSAGEHVIEVEVSANNHSAYTVDGEPIRAMATIEVEEGAGHGHDEVATIDVDPDTAPVIGLRVEKDPKSGWNAFVDLENFEINASAASSAHVAGEGHLHLVIDGVKQGRVYGTNWHIPALSEGTHEIAFEVSANDHSWYAIDGVPIVATTSIDVAAADATQPMEEMGDPDVTISAIFEDGEVTIEASRIEVELGQIVMVMVESDVDEEVHVHGYDEFLSVPAGESAMIQFAADVPGLFEIEFEDSGVLIADLQVS